MKEIQNILPTPGLNLLEEAGIGAWALKVEKVTFFENLPRFDKRNDRPLIPALQDSPFLSKWMDSVVSSAERLMGRINPARQERQLQELYTAANWFNEIYDPLPRIGPRTVRQKLDKLGRDSLSIQTIEELRYIICDLVNRVLKKDPTTNLEVGARLLGTGRFWVGDTHLVGAVDLNLLQESTHLDRLFEGEIRRRLRVLEHLRKMLLDAARAYPHDHEELLGRLDRRLEAIITHANRNYGALNRNFSQETKEALKKSLQPVENGLNRILSGLTHAGSELVITEGGRFTQLHGTQLLNTFARNLRSAAPLFLGVIIAGHFALQDLTDGESPGLTFLRFGMDVFQNFSQSKIVQLSSLGLSFL